MLNRVCDVNAVGCIGTAPADDNTFAQYIVTVSESTTGAGSMITVDVCSNVACRKIAFDTALSAMKNKVSPNAAV